MGSTHDLQSLLAARDARIRELEIENMELNSKLDKYLLAFDDDTTDLIKESDIDGVEMFFTDDIPKRSKRVNYAALAKGN